MKILVVDDEPIMLEAIAKILTNDTTIQLEIARSGREALEKAESFHPHLIMMDIKLPGVNGLEALAAIRRLLPNVVAIIITAYDNFIYAQDAIRLNVFDYLLKPINKFRLLEAITKVAGHLDQQHRACQAELVRQEQYQKLRPLVERELIQTLQSGSQPELLKEYQALLDLEISAGFFMAISLTGKLAKAASAPTNPEPLSPKLSAVAEWLRRRLHCVIGPLDHQPLIVFVPLNREEYKETDFYELQQTFCTRVYEYLTVEQRLVPVRIGVGSVHLSPANFSLSYQEALLALRQNEAGLFYYHGAADPATNPAREEDLEADLREIASAVRFGHLYRVETLYHKLTVAYLGSVGEEQRQLLIHLIELVLTSYRFCRELSKDQSHRPTVKQLLTILDSSAGLTDSLTLVGAIITNLTLIIKNNRENQVKTLIIKAKTLIDQLYHQELSLEKVARAVAISPFYLSRLFREEMGVGFTEYLTRLRLEKSLMLLAQGLTVKECSFAVGYNDPNYFSRLFHKYFQLSPTAYRETSFPKKGASAKVPTANSQ
jgi:two-component system response regulator YesN